MHFTYSDEVDQDISQGDILRRTPDIDALLRQIHPHYYENKQNKYFIVLTQSCDLVRRDGVKCKARYLTLAAVRPIDALLVRKLNQKNIGGIAVCTEKTRHEQFLERLINNNEPEYFYLHDEPTVGIISPHCAFLALSVPIRADIHYQKCLDARILSLQETFKAKLGWLVGQMYSRVGTRDWDAQELRARIALILDEAALWVDRKGLRFLEEEAHLWETQHPGEQITSEEIIRLSNSIPTRKQTVIARIEEIMNAEFQGVEGVDARKLRGVINRLRNDPKMSEFLR